MFFPKKSPYPKKTVIPWWLLAMWLANGGWVTSSNLSLISQQPPGVLPESGKRPERFVAVASVWWLVVGGC